MHTSVAPMFDHWRFKLKCTSGRFQNKDLLTVKGSRPNDGSVQCVYRDRKNYTEWFRVRDVVPCPVSNGDFVLVLSGLANKHFISGKAVHVEADASSLDHLYVRLENGLPSTLARGDLVPMKK